MSTLKQAMLLDGQALSNNDPNIVITLTGADAAKVEISEIGDDYITYSFKEGVPTDTLYDLSLSFVYKELYTLDQPLSLVNMGTESKVTITSAPINTTCWARGDALPFTVSKGGEDVTANVVDVVFTPKSIVKAGDTGSKSWTIESESAFSQTTINIDYTFRLSDDLPGVTRSFTGEFIVAAYDGQELTITPLFEEFKIPVGTLTPLKFSFKYRNYRDGTDYVRYLQNFASTAPINYSSQDLKKDTQQIWVTFGASGSFTGEGTLVFGGNGTNSVVGKNRVDIKVDMKAYVEGLALISRDPLELQGKEGTVIEQTAVFELDGEPFDAKDLDWSEGVNAFIEVVSAVGDKVTWKIIKPNNTGGDILQNVSCLPKIKGSSLESYKVRYIQKVTVKSMQQVTVLPASAEMTIKKQGYFDYPITISDGNGVEYKVDDPKVKIVVATASQTTGQFIDKYDSGFIGKLIYTGAATSAGIQYQVTIDGVPGVGTTTPIITIPTGAAVTDCTYTLAGSLPPNQETVVMNNKYQIGSADVTVDKVLLSKYVNNPSTGNAIIELLDKPTTTNNIGFGRNVKTGWTGALAEMTEYVRLPGANIVYKATGSQLVAQAPITATVLNNNFNFVDGIKTDIFATWSQERLGQEDWNFATSTDIRNISFTGTVKAATVVNENGTFRITVTGNGTKGAGSVTYSVVENNVHYPKRIDLQAIEGLSVVIQPDYKTVYGMSDSDIVVKAVTQFGGVNLGDVLSCESDNPNITVKSVVGAGGVSTVTLTSAPGTELAKQTVNLKWTITKGNEGVGLSESGTTTVYITSRKFMVYNFPRYYEGPRFSIGPGLSSKGGAVSNIIILKDGVKMNPQDNDIVIINQGGPDPWDAEIVGQGSNGEVYIKIRNDVVGSVVNNTLVTLTSDSSYTYGGADVPEASLTLNCTSVAVNNVNLLFNSEARKNGSSDYTINNVFKEGLTANPMNGTLVWYRQYNNPETGNSFFNAGESPIKADGTPNFSFELETGWTGGTARTTMLHLGTDGKYRNGTLDVYVDPTPIVVVNNGESVIAPAVTVPVTLTISQERRGDPSSNLANTTLINPTVANNLFTVTDMVNNNDGTITFNVTTTNEGTAKLSFTVKDGEFEYPASIDLAVGWLPLSLGDGFIKDVEGNSSQNVTVVQQVKIPE